MIRIPIIIFAFYVSIVAAFSQGTDSSRYESRKLSVDEVNFVTSYYHQTGNNAAVTGGLGSERLTDFATTIDVRLVKTDRRERLNSYNVEIGIDTYTSASSDKIDPTTVSSASSADQRIYPSLAWSRLNEAKGTTIGANFSLSSEYDYLSIGGGISLFKDAKDKSRQVGVRLQTYQDFVTMIYPIEQRSGKSTGTEARNTYSSTWSYAQIVNTRLQLLFLFDLTYQKGFLSMPFNRVYFNNSSVGIERLPETRIKFPVSLRANYFLGDLLIIRAFYRYYQDDWGLKSHTAELETPVKVTPFISVVPFYRYYNQSAVNYFARFGEHALTERNYTSDYDLSKFESHFAGLGFRMVSPNGLLGINRFNMIEIRYGHYSRQTGLVANIISLNAKFK